MSDIRVFYVAFYTTDFTCDLVLKRAGLCCTFHLILLRVNIQIKGVLSVPLLSRLLQNMHVLQKHRTQ